MTDRSEPNDARMLHVFLGTKAQYIKTAPLLRLLDEGGVEYRLIDSGQHASISSDMRTELGVREPDYRFGGAKDITRIGQAVRWALSLAARLRSSTRLRDEVFGGRGGIVVVHGDTPSTLLSALMARRAGLRVAHLESGLRSGKLTHPFPEEIIRILVMRLADIDFAPNAAAAENLRRMKVKARIVELEGNTSHEALAWAMSDSGSGHGPVLVTMHRVENLRTASRVKLFVDTVIRVARSQPVKFVLHGPTRDVIETSDYKARLEEAGVEMVDLLAHNLFVEAIIAAPFVITDGGSIQEECAHLGVPTLLWRDRTEWEYGIGSNVVLSHYDESVIDEFLEDPQRLRATPAIPESRPSEHVLEVLLAELQDGR